MINFKTFLSIATFLLLGFNLLAGYDPNTGRFLSRDPIGEEGGVNLYAFCSNNGISKWDYLGLLKVNRDSNEDFACVSTEKGDTLDALGAEIGMLSAQALNDRGWLYTKKDGSEHASSFSAGNVYYIPNVWITANLMHGGDIVDMGIVSWGGVFGWSYKPDGAKEVKESELQKLPGTVLDNKGKIFGITIYAHGDKLGFISNSGNITRTAGWTGGIDWIHTMDVLRALDAGGYKVAEAHPMQCYSTYKGRAQYGPLKHNPDPNRYSPDEFKKMFFLRTGLNPTGEVTGTTESVLYYEVDWNAAWHSRAVKVDGYSGVNIIGIDMGN
ncbi:MAG TPA: hypothetical protein DET40_21610 [Lentisphaeria bacterium]|nr:hypothetical protein [Lentisphaeria bacterium]